MDILREAKHWVYERATADGRARRARRGLDGRARQYDAWTFEVIDRVVRPDSGCVDVGCHEGLILQHLVERAPTGRHFAFEPLPHLAAGLRERFPGVQVVEAALSDHPGEAEFVHVVSNPGYSGLRERRYDREGEELARIGVRLTMLDSVVPADVRIDFVKIDVEGAELQVLRGATATLSRWAPVVVFEHGLGAADHYGTEPEAVHDLLAGCGLQVSLLDVYLAGGRPLRRPDFAARFRHGADYYFVAHPR